MSEQAALELRCPMRECRRRIDLATLPGGERPPDPLPCLHFIAAWGSGRASLPVALWHGLLGNRELLIRNIREAQFDAPTLEQHAASIEALVERFATAVHITGGNGNARDGNADGAAARGAVRGGAVFGDQYERDALARELAQLLIGPDPMVYRAAGR